MQLWKSRLVDILRILDILENEMWASAPLIEPFPGKYEISLMSNSRRKDIAHRKLNGASKSRNWIVLDRFAKVVQEKVLNFCWKAHGNLSLCNFRSCMQAWICLDP